MDFLSKLFKGFGGMAQGAGKAVGGFFNPSGVASSLGQGVGQNLLSSFMQSKSQGGGGKPPNLPMMGGARPAQRYGASTPIPSGIGATGVSVSPAQKQGGFGKSLMDLFGSSGGKIGAGVLSNFAGQAFAPKVNMPDINSLSSVQNLRGFSGANMPKGVEDAINRSVDLEHEQQNRQLRDVYKNARPGTDYLTDSAYQRDLANLQSKQVLNRADAQANSLLQFNQQELGHLQEVAQLDVYSIMAKLGMDAQEAEQFKQSFSNVGSMFMQSGLGLNQFDLSGLLGRKS